MRYDVPRPRRRSPFPSPTHLRELRTLLHTYPNVVGSWVGLKATDGITRPLISIVVAVTRKLPPRTLRDDRIPSRVSWQDMPARRRSLATDIVELRPHRRLKNGLVPIAGPGDYVAGPGNSWGTIGAAIRLPSGTPALTTAGHVFGPFQHAARVWADDRSRGEGLVLLREITDALDVAILAPPNGLAADNLYLDVARIRGTYEPAATDLSSPLKTLTTRGALPTTLKGLDGAFRFADGSSWTHCLLTSVTTRRGDSGSLLVDDADRALGVLRGSVTDRTRAFDCYVPINALLRRVGADWI